MSDTAKATARSIKMTLTDIKDASNSREYKISREALDRTAENIALANEWPLAEFIKACGL